MQDETPIIPRPRRRFRVPVGGLVTLALAAAVGVVWWWHTPRTMRLVDRQRDPHALYWLTDDGIVMSLAPVSWRAGESTTLALKDWRGRRRWLVTLPAINYTGWALPRGSVASVFPVTRSPDGRVLAAAIPQKNSLLVATWRNGKPLGICTIHIGPREALHGDWRPSILARDDGRVFLWLSGMKTSPILVIEGSRVIARGTHTSQLTGTAPLRYWRRLAPDGTTLLCGLLYQETLTPHGEYAALAITGSRVVVTPYPTLRVTHAYADEIFSVPWLFTGGSALFEGKLLIRPDGTTITFTDWTSASVTFSVTQGRYLLQRHVNERERHRLYETTTGKVWPIPVTAEEMDVMTFSANGRYVLVRERGMPRYTGAQEAFMRLVYRIPRLGAFARKRLEQRDELCLYERSGRLRAVLPVEPEKHLYFAFLTPNGRHVSIVREFEPSEENSFSIKQCVYAW